MGIEVRPRMDNTPALEQEKLNLTKFNDYAEKQIVEEANLVKKLSTIDNRDGKSVEYTSNDGKFIKIKALKAGLVIIKMDSEGKKESTYRLGISRKGEVHLTIKGEGSNDSVQIKSEVELKRILENFKNRLIEYKADYYQKRNESNKSRIKKLEDMDKFSFENTDWDEKLV